MVDILLWIFATMAFVLWADIWNPNASKQRIITIAMAVPILITLLMTAIGFWAMMTDTQGHAGAMAFFGASFLLVGACGFSLFIVWPVAWLTLRFLRKGEETPAVSAENAPIS